MPELRCKSVRVDATFTAADYDEVWSWAPERNVKIKAITCSLDIPSANGTIWGYVSKGAVGMVNPDPGPNEEEMILFAIHARADTAAGGEAATNAALGVEFGSDYMEIEDGEKVYLMGRGPTAEKAGYSLCIYYL